MRVVTKYLKAGLIILLFLISFTVFSQPPFTPPGQGGNPPPNPCGGPPGTPCNPIPVDSGISLLLIGGALIGGLKIYRLKKKI